MIMDSWSDDNPYREDPITREMNPRVDPVKAVDLPEIEELTKLEEFMEFFHCTDADVVMARHIITLRNERESVGKLLCDSEELTTWEFAGLTVLDDEMRKFEAFKQWEARSKADRQSQEMKAKSSGLGASRSRGRMKMARARGRGW